MVDESDGVEESLHGGLRVGLTAAGYLAEHAARGREQAAREAQAVSEQQARELQARLDADRASARAALAPVERDEWWQRAQPDDIARAWETAQTWRQIDPDAQRVAARIGDEVRTRYGVDVDDLRADPAAVRDAVERREREEQQARRQRQEARQDETEAALLMAESSPAEHRHEPAQASTATAHGRDHYDSAQRRENLASKLEGVADAEAIEARVVADSNQARPAREAVSTAPTKAPRARKTRGAGARTKLAQRTIQK